MSSLERESALGQIEAHDGLTIKEIIEEKQSMYSEKVMDHFQHPRNVGEIENASGVGTVGNAKCGDIMRM